MLKKSLFIDGHWLAGAGSRLISTNPANNQPLWQGSIATAEQVDQAVQSAITGFSSWSDTPLAKRQAIIQRFVEVVKENQSQLAQAIAEEVGKPLWEARTEVAAIIAKAAISQQAYSERSGEKTTTMAGGHSVIRHRPHGVVAVLGPYNFPGHLPNGHIIPALLAGNSVVFKPSELTPEVAEYMVNYWQQAGLPAGVLNLVQGGKAVGQALAAHPQVSGLLFTGSATTGLALHRQFAGQPEKLLALEMGGNNPLIVTQVADLKAAVYSIIQSAYITSGQRCTCARRLLIPRGKWGDQLLNQLITAVKAIRVAPYDKEPPSFMGPVISAAAAQQIINAQQHLTDLGGTALVPCQILTANTGLLSPGLIEVTAINELPDEEYFGPLLQVIRYTDFDQAIELANRTRFGLAAGLLADEAELYERFTSTIRAGIVNWNKPTTGASSAAPFGGVGISGNHRPSAYYAADYCAYPVASMEAATCLLPEQLSPGIKLS